MATIELINSSKSAIVDYDVYERVSQLRWMINPNGYIRCTGGERIYLHQLVMGKAPQGYEWDHKDGDKLNNLRSNLRLVTHAQNNIRRGKYAGTFTSEYKGVSWMKNKNKWRAQIKVDGKQTHIGLFASEEDAAKAYDEAAIKYFGEFAYLNFNERENV